MEKMIELECCECSKKFERSLKKYKYRAKKYNRNVYCSFECSRQHQIKTTTLVPCGHCHNNILKQLQVIKNSKSGLCFCSHSCAAKYNNTHKTTGTRRSKMEIWLEEELKTKYPNLNFVFNKTNAINAELDIYIPSLKLAFELNGIFHYEPIYGEEKLNQIQNNDNRKFQACLEQGIELCILDTSSVKHFKPNKGLKYLDIITSIIDKKIP